MKKSLSIFLAILMIMSLTFHVSAATVEKPQYPATSDYVQTELDMDNNQIIVTIAKDATGPIHVNLGEIGEIVDKDLHVPGQTSDVKIKIVNQSAQKYAYLPESVVLGTDAYETEINQHPVPTFDGYNVYLGSWNDVIRCCNAVLYELDPNVFDRYSMNTTRKNLTDEAIGQALRNKGYGTEDMTNEEITVSYLGEYYLDYYNDHYESYGGNEEVDRLENASMKYIRTIFTCGNAYREDLRETNPDVAALGYYFLYNSLFTVNGEPLSSYMVENSEPLKKLDTLLSSQFTAANLSDQAAEADLTFQVDFYMDNCYQNHDIVFNLAFTLDDTGSKTSYPGLEKKIQSGEELVDADTVAAGDQVDFVLTSNVPEDLTNYLKPAEVNPPEVSTLSHNSPLNGGTYLLTFEDRMDPQLIFNEDSLKVTVNGKDVPSDLYTLESTVAEGQQTIISLTLDLVELYDAEYFTQAEFGTAPIVLTYSATAATDITAGTYYNTAWVEYEGGETETDIVQVDTFQLSVFKYDQETNAPLPGAEFELYQKDAEGNVIESSIIKLTSGSDGYAIRDGLDAGTYYLKETKAPEGYVASETELEVVISVEKSTDHVVSVQFANALIPHTGGSGTVVYTVVGIAILAAAAVLFLISRKKKRA